MLVFSHLDQWKDSSGVPETYFGVPKSLAFILLKFNVVLVSYMSILVNQASELERPFYMYIFSLPFLNGPMLSGAHYRSVTSASSCRKS